MDHPNPENGNQLLSRRAAIKALTAVGGATALSTLPNRWEKPIVQVGTLPAFAQTSPAQYPFTNDIESIEFEDINTGTNISNQFQFAAQPGWLIVAPQGTTVGSAAYGYPWIITRPWLKIKRQFIILGPPWAPVIRIKIKIRFFKRPGFGSSNVPKDDIDFWCFGISGANLGLFQYYAVKIKIKNKKAEFEFLLPAIGSGLFPFYLSGFFPSTIVLLNGTSLFPGFYLGPGCFGDSVTTTFFGP